MREATYPLLTAEELVEAGQALFGAHWRGEFSRLLGCDEALIAAVEAGRLKAPPDWRARLIAVAQDAALRAMDTASALLWREPPAEEKRPAYEPPRLV